MVVASSICWPVLFLHILTLLLPFSVGSKDNQLLYRPAHSSGLSLFIIFIFFLNKIMKFITQSFNLFYRFWNHLIKKQWNQYPITKLCTSISHFFFFYQYLLFYISCEDRPTEIILKVFDKMLETN